MTVRLTSAAFFISTQTERVVNNNVYAKLTATTIISCGSSDGLGPIVKYSRPLGLHSLLNTENPGLSLIMSENAAELF